MIVAIALMLFLTACVEVTSTAPVGSKAVPIDAEEWNGTWLDDDDEPVLFRVVDSANGILKMSGIEESDGTRRWVHSYVYLRTVPGHEGWIFASYQDKPADHEPPGYLWARVKRQGEFLLVWLPDSTKFEELVEEGALPGEVIRGEESGNVAHITLDEFDEEHLALIASEERGVLFDWDDPRIWWRSKGLDPM
jgi:hypothetical protein